MRRLGLACALLLCAAVSVGLASPKHGRVIYVLNDSTLVTNAQIVEALPAFQSQIDEDLGPAWNVDATLIFASEAPPGAWKITVTDNPACLFCGGYHEWTGGLALAEVGATTDRGWQVAFSHELTELLVDPYIHGDGNGGRLALDGKRAWLVEVADPVEDDQFAYERDGVLLSDFALPSWYHKGSQGPWDFTGDCKHAGQVLEGGYQWFIRQGRWVSL